MGQRIIIQGFGGQGIKSAGDLLLTTLFKQGARVQGMPIFEPVQMGGLVTYFVAMDSDGDRVVPTRDRDVLILTHRQLYVAENAASVRPGGLLLVNAPAVPPSLARDNCRVATVDAESIARSEGLARANVSNISTVMLGALASTVSWIDLTVLEAVIRTEFPRSIPENLRALRAGYDQVDVAEPVATA